MSETDDFAQAFTKLFHDIGDVIDILMRNATSCEHQREWEAASAYRQSARMLRRIQAGEAPGDVMDDLRTSLEIFRGWGDRWQT